MERPANLHLDDGVPHAAGIQARWSVRTLLIWLVLACLLPGILGATALIIYEYKEGRAQLENDTVQTARALSQTVDHQVSRIQALAEGLSTADSLAAGDLEKFHQQARRTIEKSGVGFTVSLTEPSGQQVVNTWTEFGQTLPAHGEPELVRQVFDTGKPVVSKLYHGTVIGRPLISTAVPVIFNDKIAYALTIGFLPESFESILTLQGLPEGWVATILDSTDTIVARSRESETYRGQKPAALFLERRGASDEGRLEFVMKDGVPVLSVYTRSPLTRWTVAVSIPLEALQARLFQRLWLMILGVVVLFISGLGLSWAVAGKIARPIRDLRSPAFALGDAHALSIPSHDVKEVAEVMEAMRTANELLRERAAALSASEEKYRTLFTNMTEAFILGEPILDDTGAPVDVRFLEVNRAFHAQTGIPEGIEGRPVRDYLPQAEHSWIERFSAVALTGQPDRFDSYNADTQRHYGVFVFCPRPGFFAVLGSDITEQKRVEKALQESDSSRRQLISTLPGMVWTANSEGSIDFISQQWFDYTGACGTSDLARRWLACLHPEDRARIAGQWQEVVAGKTLFHGEFRLRRHDGVYRWFKSRGTPAFSADGQVSRWLGVVIDIDDLKQAEASRARDQELLSTIVDSIPVMIGVCGPKGDFQLLNREYERVAGWNTEDAARLPMMEGLYPDPLLRELIFGFVTSGEGWMDVPMRCQDGRVIDASWANLRLSDGRLVGIGIDVTERKRNERSLREERDRARSYLQVAGVMLLVLNTRGRIETINRRGAEILGYTEENRLIGQDWFELAIPEEEREEIRNVFANILASNSAASVREGTVLRADGCQRWISWRNVVLRDAEGQIIGTLSSGEDITERREAEAVLARDKIELERRVDEKSKQLLEVQKMEALGRLTGGVAHDFNNVLQGVSSCLSVIDRYVPDGDPRTLLKVAKASIDTGANLTKAMLAFARRQTLAPEAVEMRQLLDAIGPLLERTLGGLIGVTYEVRPGTPAALVDRAQFESALLNLAINARDAMPSGGLLTLRAAKVIVHKGDNSYPAELVPGTYVLVSVEDTGTGMDEATLGRVFDPFFTTKEVGKGTGLGLSMVHGLAAQSGGAVSIASVLGQGTTVSLYLPTATVSAKETPQAEVVVPPGNGSTVLLVDDNPMVRTALKFSIEALGYRVVDANGGPAAIKILKELGRIDLLVTDYAMPGMDGCRLAQAIRREMPGLPVLLITGYAECPHLLDNITLLQKPFAPDALAASLAALLQCAEEDR